MTPPPDIHGEQTDHPPEEKSADQPGVSAESDNGHPPVAAEEWGGGRKPWDTTISVPPSKAVRDGVCFRGLCVLVFVVEEEQQPAVVRKKTPWKFEGDLVCPVTVPYGLPSGKLKNTLKKGVRLSKTDADPGLLLSYGAQVKSM